MLKKMFFIVLITAPSCNIIAGKRHLQGVTAQKTRTPRVRSAAPLSPPHSCYNASLCVGATLITGYIFAALYIAEKSILNQQG